jgi:hypothetical protein
MKITSFLENYTINLKKEKNIFSLGRFDSPHQNVGNLSEFKANKKNPF